MCLLIAKPAGKIIPRANLEDAFYNNDDGAGFGIVEKDENDVDELNIHKGFFEFEDFWKEWEPHQEKQAIIHFRIATHRAVDGVNCHPFRINDDLIIAHNGSISGLPSDPNCSDTNVFTEKIIKPLINKNPDFWTIPEFQWIVETAIGSSNKLVMMDVKGRFVIFNEKEGNTKDGVWYSNYSANYRKGGTFYNTKVTPPPKKEVIDVESTVETDKKEEPSQPEQLNLDEKFSTESLEEVDKFLEEANAS